MLRVDIKSVPPAVTLVCAGRLVLGVEAETLRCMVTSRSERDVLLELSRVDSIDAAGLGLLIELHHWARRNASNLTITNPSQAAHKLLALTSLDRVLHIVGKTNEIAERGPDEWRTMTA
jgi:anti-anti-sigma factor